MKTAMFKTDFWEEDGIFALNTDTKAVYLCLLTNPKRDLTPAFKLNDRMLSAYSGFGVETLQTCRKQLTDAGLIFYIDGYYILPKQSYVEPLTGRDSKKIFDRDFDKLPASVKQFIYDNDIVTPKESTSTPTSTSTGVIDIDINIDKDITITKESNVQTNIHPEAIRLATLLQNRLVGNFGERVIRPRDKQVSDWAKDIEKINRINNFPYDIIEYMVNWCQDNDFWKANIMSGSKLRKQFARLMAQAKVEYDRDKNRVVIAGQEQGSIFNV